MLKISIDLEKDSEQDNEFKQHIDDEGYYKVPEVELDEDQKNQDIEKKHIDKAKVGKDLDEFSVNDSNEGD